MFQVKGACPHTVGSSSNNTGKKGHGSIGCKNFGASSHFRYRCLVAAKKVQLFCHGKAGVCT